MPQTVPAYEPTDPKDVCFLGSKAVMHVPQPLSDLVQEPDRGQRRLAIFVSFVSTVHAYSILPTSSTGKRALGRRIVGCYIATAHVILLICDI